jgi:hypothetical protein
VLYFLIKKLEVAAGDAVSYGPVIVNTLKSALLLPAMPLGVFFMSNNALEDLVPPYKGRVPPAH